MTTHLTRRSVVIKQMAVGIIILVSSYDDVSAQHTAERMTSKDAQEQFVVGTAYVLSGDVCENREKGFNLVSAAASQGHVEAQYTLARFYRSGVGVDQNEAKHLEWLERSAAAGHAAAKGALWLAYARDRSLGKDPGENFGLLLDASEAGDTTAMYNAAQALRTGRDVAQDFGQALKWYRRAADKGHPGASQISTQYEDIGLDQNTDQSALFSQHLSNAEAGEPSAQTAAALMYYHGIGTGRDPQSGFRWLKTAADQNHPRALFYLSFPAQWRNARQPMDAAGIRRMLRRSAELGDNLAQFRLAVDILQGRSTDDDPPNPFRLLSEATKTGNLDAQFLLAKLHLDGEIVSPASNLAPELIESLAINKNHLNARLELGLRYKTNIQDDGGIDYRESFKWIFGAAQDGQRSAAFHLADSYERGLGVLQNTEQALYWYGQAANAGQARAKARLTTMMENQQLCGDSNDRQDN